MPFPPRSPDAPLFDPARPFYGDESGELLVAPSRPMPPELSAAHAELAAVPSIAGLSSSALSTSDMSSAAFTHAGASYAEMSPAGEFSPTGARGAQQQPSRRTVAIGAFIAVAVVIFAIGIAVHSCGEPAAPTNGASTNGAPNNGAPNNGAPNNGAPNNGAPNNGALNNGASTNGAPTDGAPNNGAKATGGSASGVPSSGSATKPRPTVEPIHETRPTVEPINEPRPTVEPITE